MAALSTNIQQRWRTNGTRATASRLLSLKAPKCLPLLVYRNQSARCMIRTDMENLTDSVYGQKNKRKKERKTKQTKASLYGHTQLEMPSGLQMKTLKLGI